jgi:hypothetical protein
MNYQVRLRNYKFVNLGKSLSLVVECENSGVLLTPQLLEEWWKLENVNCSYSAEFYSRLLATLNPALQTRKKS